MLKLQRIFKNYQETGSFNEQVNLYGFIDSNVFLTKTGDMGVILEVHGVDYECLDGNALDGITKRLESALKLFDDKYRIYQYLFKRNNETIPYKLYGKPIVDAAIKNRVAYFAGEIRHAFLALDLLRDSVRGLPVHTNAQQSALGVPETSVQSTR